MRTGLYVHIPFCIAKCPYCDFNSRPLDAGLAGRYVTAILREIELRGTETREVMMTFYLGGGTPTCLDPGQIDAVLTGCYNAFAFSPGAEVTVEANPGTLTSEIACALKQGGVHRLSLGIQSFQPDVLRTLGRIHSSADAEEAYVVARDEGFENIGVDLIFGVPAQSLRDWQLDLDRVVRLQPEHVSTYGLTVEIGTEFSRRVVGGELQRPTEDIERAMFEMSIATLCDAGYEHYEISNFALPGKRSQHNQLYWHDENYIGLGAGAHSSWEGRRFWNERDPAAYAAKMESSGTAVTGEETLTPRRKLSEALMLGLRMLEGVSLSHMQDRYGLNVRGEFEDGLRKLTRNGLVRLEGDRLSLSREGLFLANEVVLELL